MNDAGLSRRLLLGVSAAGGGVALMSTSASARLPEPIPEASWTPGTTLTVVAHPDDDLYFINPNIVRAIKRGGAEVVGVVVTAAEGDGRNVDTDDPQRMATPIDYPGYATARQRGLRRAYAKMAGRPVDSPWRNTVVTMPDGLQVQCGVLIADPRVRLYFLAVAHTYDADGRDESTIGPLWDGTLDKAPTMPSVDAARPVQQVSRASLIACLTELLRRHRPAVIRTLDPDPEHDWGQTDFVVSDHPDHTAVARFTLAAVRGYADATGAGPLVEHYRGYANRYWPRNLGKADMTEKAALVQTYAGADGSSCAGHDCGDYQLGKNPYRSTHIYTTAERYGPSTSWLARGADGAMVAAAAIAGRVAVWTETAPGSGAWTKPQHLAGGWITPSLVVVAGKDGRTHLVGLRRTEGSGGEVTIDVVHAVRTGSGRFSAWRSLDGPDSADPDRRKQREVGVPAATVDAAGRLWVFARNFQGTLSARQERAGGRWSAWRTLGGGLLQDSPTALTTRAGLVEVLAPGKKFVYRWRQRKPGGTLVADQAGHTTPVASNGLHAVESGGGRVCLYYRKAESGALLTYREKAAPGGWPGGPEALGGRGGTGPVATAGRVDAGARDAVLVHRNRDYGTSVAYPGRLVHDEPVWHRVPGVIAGGPSLAFDQSDRLVLAVLGQDGRLHVKRQRAAKPNIGFGPWLTV